MKFNPLFITAILWLQIPNLCAADPIPRQDAFFGLHFDLHPQKSDTELGADITEAMIEKLLSRVKPDYVQYDCKGHAGYAGYPTKIGTPSPGIVKDSLALWRSVTQRNDVGLYIHFSGVWDSVAVEKHPEWARIDAEGKADANAASVFGPYVDELLIPQLKEVVAAYDLDGLWVDGECWSAKLDYSPAALEQWKKETGYEEAPKSRTDAHWLEWKMFHRRHFERYLCHWVDALHEFRPDLQITSNWMYTTLAPTAIVCNLDYLSGDYSPGQSVARAQVDARYLASTGMPWDLMAWGFNKGENLQWSLKTPVQLQQEAAVVLMQGGGFQIYNNPTRSGYLHDAMIETLGQVSDFCKKYEKVSHKSASVPQVALLLSTESMWDNSDQVYSTSGKDIQPLEGALQALLELHYSVDILAEHHLQPRLSEFPLVVIPEAHKLTDDFKEALMNYVEEGGNLLLLGEKCARLFEPALGVEFVGAPENVRAELAASTGPVNANGDWQKVKLTSAKATGYRHPTRDTRKDGDIAATIADHGKGRIGAIYGPVALGFYRGHHPYLRQFIGDLAKQLFSKPAIQIDGPPCVDVALRKTKDGKLSVHLLNRMNAPVSDRYGIIDYVPPVGPITLRIDLKDKPEKVYTVPRNRRLRESWENGVLTVTLPRMQVYSVLVVE
ncbi:MAG: hypothetical protein C4527_13675 [Candidatus Omnitrophota bacterium]|jgi:hypothetical protein|nr:MAG: hypothetical protein C4527_13675 [Candidatus Omnitrophota bacterium]